MQNHLGLWTNCNYIYFCIQGRFLPCFLQERRNWRQHRLRVEIAISWRSLKSRPVLRWIDGGLQPWRWVENILKTLVDERTKNICMHNLHDDYMILIFFWLSKIRKQCPSNMFIVNKSTLSLSLYILSIHILVRSVRIHHKWPSEPQFETLSNVFPFKKSSKIRRAFRAPVGTNWEILGQSEVRSVFWWVRLFRFFGDAFKLGEFGWI